MTVSQPLYEIENELMALLDSAETCPEELLPELQNKIELYLNREIQKIDQIGHVFSMLMGTIGSANLEISRLEARKRTAERSMDRLEKYIIRVLESRNGEPLKGRNVTFSLRRTKAVVITDPASVPAKFKVIKTPEVDIPKVPLRAALEALKALACPECEGTGRSDDHVLGLTHCCHCEGSGVISETIPGAELRENVHLVRK